MVSQKTVCVHTIGVCDNDIVTHRETLELCYTQSKVLSIHRHGHPCHHQNGAKPQDVYNFTEDLLLQPAAAVVPDSPGPVVRSGVAKPARLGHHATSKTACHSSLLT